MSEPVALKRFRAPDGSWREPGDHAPEAKRWRQPEPWYSQGFVKDVPEVEIVDGRWVKFGQPAPEKLPTPAPARVEPEPPEEPEEVPLTREDLEEMNKSQLYALAEDLDVEYDVKARKAELVDQLLEAMA